MAHHLRLCEEQAFTYGPVRFILPESARSPPRAERSLARFPRRRFAIDGLKLNRMSAKIRCRYLVPGERQSESPPAIKNCGTEVDVLPDNEQQITFN